MAEQTLNKVDKDNQLAVADKKPVIPNISREERIAELRERMSKQNDISVSQEPIETEAQNEVVDKKEQEENNKKQKSKTKQSGKEKKDSAAEKLAKEKEKRYKYIYQSDTLLQKFFEREKKRLIKSIITTSSILVILIAGAAVLASMFNPILAAITIPFIGISIWKVLSAFKKLKRIKNPYELYDMLIKEKEKKDSKLSQKQMITDYNREKKRIKQLKQLPYKVLASISFLLSMFTIIFFYFVVGLKIPTMLIILFSVFTVSYFLVGVMMITVFYMISENRLRLKNIKDEEEKKRKSIEERIKNDAILHKKLDDERRKYEEVINLHNKIEEKQAAELEAERLRREEERQAFETSLLEKKQLVSSRIAKANLLSKSLEEQENETKEIKKKINSELLEEIKEEIKKYNFNVINDLYEKDILSLEESSFNEMEIIDDDIDIKTELENTLIGGKNYLSNDINKTKKNVEHIEEEKKHVLPDYMSPVSGTKKTNIPAQVMPPAPDLNKQKNINPKSVSIFKELIKE
ncbi:MAG: hypothetical protein GX372_06635 [Ignavibacteria bacterium]|mgnify:CR=1 FL=1|jgi:hypothetical protein|nr:hypothetical protein [Ignavibacteria bacterium]